MSFVTLTVKDRLVTPGPKVRTPPAAAKSTPRVAVLEAALHSTVAAPVMSPVRETVTDFVAVASPTEKSGALKPRVGGVYTSSSRIVSEALLFRPIKAPNGALSVRLRASLPSGAESAVIGTLMAFDISPATNESVPEVAV